MGRKIQRGKAPAESRRQSSNLSQNGNYKRNRQSNSRIYPGHLGKLKLLQILQYRFDHFFGWSFQSVSMGNHKRNLVFSENLKNRLRLLLINLNPFLYHFWRVIWTLIKWSTTLVANSLDLGLQKTCIVNCAAVSADSPRGQPFNNYPVRNQRQNNNIYRGYRAQSLCLLNRSRVTVENEPFPARN